MTRRKAKLGLHADNPRRHSATAYKGARHATKQAHSTTERVAHKKRRRH